MRETRALNGLFKFAQYWKRNLETIPYIYITFTFNQLLLCLERKHALNLLKRKLGSICIVYLSNFRKIQMFSVLWALLI